MNHKQGVFEDLEDATSNHTDISWCDWKKKVIIYDIIYLTEIMKHLIITAAILGPIFHRIALEKTLGTRLRHKSSWFSPIKHQPAL